MTVDTSQKTESIEQLATSIEKSDVALPEFQRDFVWEEAKTYDLFDSIIRDIFIGSLIFGIPSFELTVRELDKRPRKGAGSRKKLEYYTLSKEEINKLVKTGQFRLLLDGQQRATALYRALSGIDQVWIVIKKDKELDEKVKGKAVASRSLEEVLYEVSSRESPERMSIKVSDVYRMLKGQIVREKEKAALLGATAYWKAQQAGELEKSSVFDEYLTYTGKLIDILKAEKLLSYYLLDTDEEKFCLFFERSNSKGIQLDFIDILAAKLYAGFNLRKKIDEFKDSNPGFALGRDEIVRSIAFLESKGKNIGRQYILSELSHTHFTKHWDTVCGSYRKCLDYLYDNNYMVSQEWLPYDSMMIPLVVFVQGCPSKDFSQITEVQAGFLKFWYWAVVFTQRYSSASQDTILTDARILQSVAGGSYDPESLRSYLRGLRRDFAGYDEILGASKKYSAVYKGVFNLISWHAGGIRDWKNNNKISLKSTSTAEGQNLDDHHVFPKKYLRNAKKDMEDALVDSVLNRALVPKITNIKIGGRAPSDYLKELSGANGKLSESLDAHLIPVELVNGVYDDLYEIFLEDRGKRVVKVISEDILALESALEEKMCGKEQ